MPDADEPIIGDLEFSTLCEILSDARLFHQRLNQFSNEGRITEHLSDSRMDLLASVTWFVDSFLVTVVEAQSPSVGLLPAIKITAIPPTEWKAEAGVWLREPVETPALIPRYGFHFQSDWLRAALDVVIERKEFMFQTDDVGDSLFFSYFEPFYATFDIRVRWHTALGWSKWRKNRLLWKEMVADLARKTVSPISIRTLQRKAMDMGLLKDW